LLVVFVATTVAAAATLITAAVPLVATVAAP
jgi:hypothetical protein